MKPDEIPQGVWDTALDVAWEADGTDHPFVVEPIARAIMAERGACAAIAEGYRENMSFWMAKEWKVAKEASEFASESIAAAIRNRP